MSPGPSSTPTPPPAKGQFSLDAGASPADECFVQVVPGVYQGGFVGGGYVQPSPGVRRDVRSARRDRQGPRQPGLIAGRVLNSRTRRPVGGIRATACTSINLSQVEGTDVTDKQGRFRVNGIECEDDCYLKMIGAPKGYEVGYRAGNARVVPAWGDACASPIGRIGKVFLDKS